MMRDNILFMFYYWAYPVVHVFHFSLTTLGTNLKSENTIVVLVAGPTKLNMPYYIALLCTWMWKCYKYHSLQLLG